MSRSARNVGPDSDPAVSVIKAPAGVRAKAGADEMRDCTSAHAYLTGFRETDLELERRVMAFLTERRVGRLDTLRIAVRGGSVILRGSVRSPSEKRLIAECCRRVAGVVNVIDLLHVPPRLTTMRPSVLPVRQLQPI